MSPQPRQPTRLPRIVAEVARPTRRVAFASDDLLERVTRNASARADADDLTDEQRERLQRVARLARELREEMRELAALEPGRDVPS